MATRPDVQDLRIEKVLPYINNPKGQSLEELLETIDDLLKDASPDAMAPGLINWGFKHLFVDKWIADTGTPSLSYNQFAESKIGKGRFEITGTGRMYYDKYLAISEVRGVTGRIFLGSTQPGAQVSVGVLCYDADKNLLGTNGGFLCNSYEPLVNIYDFFKTSAFGEMPSGARFLKPNTRFVRFYIEIQTNPAVVFFDESELTTFELDERYRQFFGTEIDWNMAEFFYTEITGDTTFSYRNDLDGRAKTIIIKNTGIDDLTVTFPPMKWQGGYPLELIRPGRTSIFTIIKGGGITYGAVIEEME